MNPAGRVYIVATPIGNLQDITYRAVEILRTVPLVAAEDTRHTRILLKRYNIQVPLISYYEHNRYSRIPQLINHLQSGRDLAVVTDAGTPGISDPAYRLIRSAVEAGITVHPIPGASALLTALAASGLPTDRFYFEGFLPLKKGRTARLKKLAAMEATIVLYEAPGRLLKTLREIQIIFGERPAVVGRELTKLNEEFVRGKLGTVIQHFSSRPVRGECVLLIGKDDPNVQFPE